MLRKLVISTSCQRKLSNFKKNHPDLRKKLEKVFVLLQNDIFIPILETHKLSGRLKLFYACKIDYSYRLIFAFDKENVYLLNIGSHDEVY